MSWIPQHWFKHIELIRELIDEYVECKMGRTLDVPQYVFFLDGYYTRTLYTGLIHYEVHTVITVPFQRESVFQYAVK